MIATLRGKITEVHAGSMIVEAGGVGYEVKAAPATLSEARVGEERLFHVHDHVREDVRDLYGFAARAEKEFFERLLSISGVGPKVALTIMSAGSLESLRRAISQADLALLTSVPGVGKKTAQKIILELQGRLVDEAEIPSDDLEVVEALVTLGYPQQQAREAVKATAGKDTDVAERVRRSLRYLAK